MDQGERFEIYSLSCNKVLHQGEQIKVLCLRLDCNQPSAACQKCTQELHQDCQADIQLLKDLPQIVLPLQRMLSQLTQLNIKINQQMMMLSRQIELNLKSINQYSNTPNLTNLNELGQSLKFQTEVNIKKQIEIVELKIQQEFEEYKNNLNLYQRLTIDQKIDVLKIQMENLWVQKLDSQALSLVDDFLSKIYINTRLLNLRGFALNKLKRFQESIYCFERVTTIDPNDIYAWNNQGFGLNELNRFQESINCFDQTIKIDPNNVNAWNNKDFHQINQNDTLKQYIVMTEQYKLIQIMFMLGTIKGMHQINQIDIKKQHFVLNWLCFNSQIYQQPFMVQNLHKCKQITNDLISIRYSIFYKFSKQYLQLIIEIIFQKLLLISIIQLNLQTQIRIIKHFYYNKQILITKQISITSYIYHLIIQKYITIIISYKSSQEIL